MPILRFLIFSVFSLATPSFGSAQSTDISHHTTASGRYSNPSVWSASPGTKHSAPSCVLTNSAKLDIRHMIISSCPKTEIYGNAALTVASGGLLTITGNLDIFGNGHIKIEKDASLVINGHFNVSGNASVQVDGTLIVSGNTNIVGGGHVCGSGTAEVFGTTAGEGWCSDLGLSPLYPYGLAASMNDQQKVVLEWTVSMDIDNTKPFVIERSLNGMSFAEIGKTTAQAGLRLQKYNFTDPNPQPGTIYYRVRRADNGQNTSSETIALSIRDDKKTSVCTLEVEPNPCVPWCTARITDCPNGGFSTSIMDVAGNLVQVLVPESTDVTGNIRYVINKDNFLVPGVYIIRSQGKNGTLSKKIIVK